MNYYIMTRDKHTNYARMIVRNIEGEFIGDINPDIKLELVDILDNATDDDIYFDYYILYHLINIFKQSSKKIMKFNGLFIIKYFDKLVVMDRHYGGI